MALGGKIYNIFFKSSSRYFLSLVAGAFIFERFTDGLADTIFDSINKGKQWKDIKNLYVKSADEEDAE
jgi:ubiquinol-cytochrome c reductase subunit 9